MFKNCKLRIENVLYFRPELKDVLPMLVIPNDLATIQRDDALADRLHHPLIVRRQNDRGAKIVDLL